MQCVVFLWRRGESVKGDLLLKTTYVAYVFVYVRFVLQISLHLVKFVILDGLNDHIWVGVILRKMTGQGSH